MIIWQTSPPPMAGHVVYGTYVWDNLGNVKLRFINSFHIVLWWMTVSFFNFCSPKFSRKIKWLKSIHPSLIVKMTWLDWLIYMMLVSCITQLSGTAFTYYFKNRYTFSFQPLSYSIVLAGIRMNWSTHIQASFALLSIPTRGFQSTPKEQWTFILVYICKTYYIYKFSNF